MIIEHIITGQRFEVADGTNYPTHAYKVIKPEPAKASTPEIVAAKPGPAPKKPAVKKPAPKKKTAKKKTKKSKK